MARKLRTIIPRAPLFFVALLIGSLLGLFAYWFLSNFERHEYKVRQAMSPAALNNPFLAAERYVKRVGGEAESVKGQALLAHLPSTQDAIFIRHVPASLGSRFTDDLLSWVQAGGHLLMVPTIVENPTPNRGNLAERIGVGHVLPDDDERDEVGEAAPAGDTRYHPYEMLIKLDIDGRVINLVHASSALLEDVAGNAIFRINGSYWKEYRESRDHNRPDHNRYIEQEGAWLLRYRIGRGLVTVLSDASLFTNDEIGDRDHAFFLSYLLADDEKLWLLYSSEVDALPVKLWKLFPLFWSSLAVLLGMTLWLIQMRSGPLLKPDYERSEHIISHIDAVGHFSWRTEHCHSIVAGNRRFFLSWWQKRTYGRRVVSDQEIDVSQLAARVGLSEEELGNALLLKPDTEQNIIKISRAMHSLDLALQGGDKHTDD